MTINNRGILITLIIVSLVVTNLPDFKPMRILGLKYSLQSDILFHAGYYFVVSFLILYFIQLKKLKPLFLFLLFLIPTIFEFTQQLIPGRTFSIFDILANYAGIIAAAGLFFGVKYLSKAS